MNLKLERESHKAHYKKIQESLGGFGQWVLAANNNSEKANVFVETYYVNLNNQTKASFYENILDMTDMKLAEARKKDDLMKMIEELAKLVSDVKRL